MALGMKRYVENVAAAQQVTKLISAVMNARSAAIARQQWIRSVRIAAVNRYAGPAVKTRNYRATILSRAQMVS